MKKYDSGKRNFLKLIGGLGIIAGIAYVLRKLFGSEEVITEIAPTRETHTVYADVIEERSSGVGVTIDGVLFKDSEVDSTNPTSHASRHNAGGADVMAIDAVAATGSLRTLGSGSQQAAAGNHTH